MSPHHLPPQRVACRARQLVGGTPLAASDRLSHFELEHQGIAPIWARAMRHTHGAAELRAPTN